MDRPNLVRFVLLGTIWGSSYTFIKVAVDGLTPSQLVLGRLLLGAAVPLVVLRVRHVSLPPFGRVWAHMIVPAVLGLVAPFLLLAWGERYTSAAMAGVLTAALPLMTLGVATAVLPSERATSRRTSGLLIGFVGVVLVLEPWRSELGSYKGQLAVLAATACYAGQTVYLRRYLSPLGIPALALVASQLAVAIVLQAAVTPFLEWDSPTVTWKIGISVLLLGIFGTGVGYTLYFRLIADLGATTASAVNYLVPVTALAISTTTLDESVTWNMLAGVALVLLGLAYAENRLGIRRRLLPQGAAGGG